MVRTFLIVGGLLFIAFAFKGASDALMFHYNQSFAAGWNPDFWRPAGDDCEETKTCSWTRKYKRDENGALIRPLVEKFPGSSTVFVFATDGWHLMQFGEHMAYVLAVTVLMMQAIAVKYKPRWWYWPLLFITILLVQGAGFHLVYTLL